MSRKIEELSKECITALGIFSQLILSRFGKTKKEKYEEIARRMSLPVNTVKTWIYKYYDEYKKYLEEIKEDIEKDLKRFILEGLTEKQFKYIRARMNGFGKEEAKIEAGYSEKTKVDTIEKSKGISLTMKALREKLINDTQIGAEIVVNSLLDIARRAREGVTSTEYVDETNPDGRLVRKTIKQDKSFAAELGAIKELNNMLGYNLKDEMALAKLEMEIAVLSEKKKKLAKENEKQEDTIHLE